MQFNEDEAAALFHLEDAQVGDDEVPNTEPVMAAFILSNPGCRL